MGQNNNQNNKGLYNAAYEHDACGIGFIVDIKGRKSYSIIRQGLEILFNLAHRSACGCEENTGDGAGIIIQIPHRFFSSKCSKLGFLLPDEGDYGVGMAFFNQPCSNRERIEKRVEEIIKEEGQTLLGWREVPVDNSSLGESAVLSQPVIKQVFIGRSNDIKDSKDFERKLYIIRKRAEDESLYFASLSHKTIVYKGMLKVDQVSKFYPELLDREMDSALALVHSRFSTNTFPSWDRAHPNRYIIHNGEVNTLRGNVNWMRARQSLFSSTVFKNDLARIMPIVKEEGSDSAIFDNCLEFFVLAGYSMPHAMMMMIPEPWSKHQTMDTTKKAFYEYHSCFMEPWDGPAAMAFTDGISVGAVLDRNGLRPSRYCVTDDDKIILASEVGVLNIPEESIVQKGRLMPGRMLLVDTVEGRIITDEEIKSKIASEKPYDQWLKKQLINLDELADHDYFTMEDATDLLVMQKQFGYTFEDLRMVLEPMAANAEEPLGSMGYDAPLAVLSQKPQLLYNYFKQIFAQVTNPPIDAIREEIVVGTETYLGSEGNLLDLNEESCRMIKLKHPILTNKQLLKLRGITEQGFKSKTFSICFDGLQEGAGLLKALDVLFEEVECAVDEGVNLVILSDRMIDSEKTPIPALIAVAGLHHHLIRKGIRTRVSIILESGEPREVHHFAVLLGYGVDAVNPWMAFRSIRGIIEKEFTNIDIKKAIPNYIKAVNKGIVKVLSKMGISTIQSYRGAQIFEAVGIAQSVIDKYFTWTASRLEGVDLDIIAREALMRQASAFDVTDENEQTLPSGGQYKWRSDGEVHMYNPLVIHMIQQACRTNDYGLYKKYAKEMNDQSETLYTLRGLMDFNSTNSPIPIDEVESVESIVKRFKTGAMSYGSISQQAHEALAIAMNRLGGKSNTGEGGEDRERFITDPNGDSRCSAIKQVASGRFGVTSEYLVNAQELQIKMAQGAKPGEGGQLPGAKVYPWIAKVRHSTPGVGLISPPPHHDIYSIEDLAQLIYDLKNANRKARISVKLVSSVGVGTIAAGVAKGKADVVLISGYDGGTGASPRTSIQHAGIPWELGLAETHQTLIENRLRDRIVIETDGKLMTGRDVVIAALLGAEEFGFATAPLIALGCVMMRACEKDTCPVGIASQNPELRKKFTGRGDYVVNLMRFIAQDIREIMAELAIRTIQELVGRSELLQMRSAISHWKAQGLDYSRILYQASLSPGETRYCSSKQNHGLDDSLDVKEILEAVRPALDNREPVKAEFSIKNTDRTVGTILGSEVTDRFGFNGLPEDTINLRFNGSAGQSFGAFIPKGVTLTLEGEANDYIGKGLSGGKLIVYQSSVSPYQPDKNMIIGNVAFYGATSGEAYISGMAGERFCVRNSGMKAVVEAIGDHGCEYMTGGRVVVLGPVGRNFAAGMSGGIAYVLDTEGDFHQKCNQDMVFIERLEDPMEIREVKSMIKKHEAYTKSQLGRKVLDNWDDILNSVVKVMPKDYKGVLESSKDINSKLIHQSEVNIDSLEEITA